MKDAQPHNVECANAHKARLISLMLAFLALAAYLVAVGRLAVDFPYWDDFYAVLDSLGKVRAADTAVGKAAVLVAQHNEHRLAWLRGVVVACWGIEGRVDFRTLIWLGNLGLVALATTLVLGARRSVSWPSLLALIPLALLSPIQDKQMIWAMAALSNYWVLAFAAAALLLISGRTPIAFGSACGLGVLATFTSGQGLLCFPAGAVLLLLGRQWTRMLIWLGTMAVSAGFYFCGYIRPAHHPAPEISWTAVQFFPTAVGGAVSDLLCHGLLPLMPEPRWQAAVLPSIQAMVGLSLIGLIAWLWARRYYQRNPFVSVFLLYLLLLCATASLSRSPFGLQQALAPHYKVISISIAVLAIVALLDWRYRAPGARCPEAAVWGGGLLFCLLAWCLWYPTVRAFSAEQAEAREAFRQSQDGRGIARPNFRQPALDILWHSYLTGMMPITDLNTAHGLRLSPDRLDRIATPCAQVVTAPWVGARVLSRLEWRGEDVLLIPAGDSTGGASATGYLLLQGARLRSSLPPRAGNPPSAERVAAKE